ncbi:hypothetical protein JCM19233_4905 [Vibrio astriarenae]|nr:hypothetical protein JCM19233_4905 [Vibrio sp. C7]
MNKIITLSLITLTLSACSKDVDYYKSNIEEAKVKWGACEQEMNNSHVNFATITDWMEKNPECKASHEAIEESNREIQKQQMEEKKQQQILELTEGLKNLITPDEINAISEEEATQKSEELYTLAENESNYENCNHYYYFNKLVSMKNPYRINSQIILSCPLETQKY